MKSSLPYAAATALALLMGAGTAGAVPVSVPAAPQPFPLLLAQADEVPAEEIEEPRRKRAQQRQEERAQERQQQRQERQERRQADREAESGQAAPEADAPRRERRQAEEQEPANERPRRQARPDTAEEEPSAATEAEQRPDRSQERRARRAETENGGEAEAEPRRRPRRDAAETGQQPAEDPQREARPETDQVPAEAQVQPEVRPEAEPDAAAERPARRSREEVRERRERQRAERERARGDATQTEAREPADQRDPASGEADAARPGDGEDDARQPRRNARERTGDDREEVTEERRPRRETAPDAAAEAPDDGADAPVLDSQKQERSERRGGRDQAREERRREGEREQPRREAGPPPRSDRDAQEALRPDRIESVTAERGSRRDRDADDEPRRRERPSGSEVLREIGDRLIVEFGNQVIVESNDRPRMARGARDVFYEDLPRGRTRETIERRDGSQVVTVRNRYGDVIRRSRIMPDGQEIVLVYVEERDFERVREWRDPGLDLPPMRLEVPVEEYILDARRAQDSEAYYEFLDQPPVETVERLYSVDEVKRSARIRDKIRRVDLDTLTFEFGSHTIPEDQIPRLEEVADAMARLLDENPAETFLIEGHTDAVGSDLANLALSDRRAEGVADALTDVFDIPPENLATQGYGEQYLKVRTQEPERENRRVAIRRITPLVAPVTSASR